MGQCDNSPVRVAIKVPAPDWHGELESRARKVWADFRQNIRIPLVLEEDYGTTRSQLGAAKAASRPCYATGGSGEHALLLLSPGLLKASEEECRLTLLHECIHLDFAFRTHRERWQRIEASIRERVAARGQVISDCEEDPNLTPWEHGAFRSLRVPDEIVAEQRLKRDYQEWFPRRAEYYLRMRKRRAEDLVREADPLRPFAVFDELLRVAFFIPLVEGIPTLEHIARDLRGLEASVEQQLCAVTTADLLKFFHELKPFLLSVTLDRPLLTAEAAYDRLFERTTATEPPAGAP